MHHAKHGNIFVRGDRGRVPCWSKTKKDTFKIDKTHPRRTQPRRYVTGCHASPCFISHQS